MSQHTIASRTFNVRRVPMPTVTFDGQSGKASLDVDCGEVVIGDIPGTDSDAARDELAATAFEAGMHAGALAVLASKTHSTVPAASSSSASFPSRGSLRAESTRRPAAVVQTFSGCYQVRLAYPSKLDPQWVRPQPPRV